MSDSTRTLVPTAGHWNVCLEYPDARRKIRDGDVLLFRRGDGLVSRAIAIAGRSIYSHVGMAARWGDRLMILETVQGRGGRAVFLSRIVAQHPGRIDVYGVVPAKRRRFRRAKAVAAMIETTGRRYGWANLLKVAFFHLPLVRWFIRPILSDDTNGSLPFCSHAVAAAYRAGGLDLVPNLADAATEPGDIARSAALQYRFSLVPENMPIRHIS